MSSEATPIATTPTQDLPSLPRAFFCRPAELVALVLIGAISKNTVTEKINTTEAFFEILHCIRFIAWFSRELLIIERRIIDLIHGF
jgi:hypothetical protein